MRRSSLHQCDLAGYSIAICARSRARYSPILILLLALFANGQDYVYKTGAPSFNTPLSVELGYVNLANGNLHLEIPLVTAPQRTRIPFSAKLVYDSRIWQIANNGTSEVWQPTNIPTSQGGWRLVTPVDPGVVGYGYTSTTCGTGEKDQVWQNFTWTESNGTSHVFPIKTEENQCGTNTQSGNDYAEDSSGLHMYVSGYTNATIFAKDGTQLYPSYKDTNAIISRQIQMAT